jgi:hypothetical protein
LRRTVRRRFWMTGPTSKLIRQIVGAVAEFDKAMTVAKLKGARDRKRRNEGKCEDRKSYAEGDPNMSGWRRRSKAGTDGYHCVTSRRSSRPIDRLLLRKATWRHQTSSTPRRPSHPCSLHGMGGTHAHLTIGHRQPCSPCCRACLVERSSSAAGNSAGGRRRAPAPAHEPDGPTGGRVGAPHSVHPPKNQY